MDNVPRRREKATESMKIHLSEGLKRDLIILAAYAGLDLSTYVRQVLERHTYGVIATLPPPRENGRGRPPC